jgi:hypothetical protein
MDGTMRAFLLIAVIAALGLGASRGSAAPATECTYAYADDFATDQVANDSYAHSPIVASFCYSCWIGWLLCVADSTGDRGLEFYQGQAYGSQRPFVSYRFPPEGGAGGLSGTLEFDVLPTLSHPAGLGYGIADVIVTYDGASATTARISQAGHYVFEVAPPPTVTWVGLYITGGLFRLDNLSVCIGAATPARGTTWGQLKSAYR